MPGVVPFLDECRARGLPCAVATSSEREMADLKLRSSGLAERFEAVVCGDDPWSDSTQAPVDSRFMAEHLRMPMVEPAISTKEWS